MSRRILKIMVSRHSSFYSPLIATLAAGFLREAEWEGEYRILKPGQKGHALLKSGEIDLMQAAVSSNWGPMERGETGLALHFAQINCRDGFFLASRPEVDDFEWSMLAGRSLLADHGGQPLVMLRYALWRMGVDEQMVNFIDSGSPAEMEAAFRDGTGDFIHLQGPAPHQLESEGVGKVVARVGDAVPPVAFSSLMASRKFLETEEAAVWMRAFGRAREWVQTAVPEEVAEKEAGFFPDVSLPALTRSIADYQELGCWSGPIEIPEEMYEQSLDVFAHSSAVTRRYSYSEVVVPPPIARPEQGG